MLPLIIVVVVSVALAIIAYQIIIQKYYWGPKGPPDKDVRDKKRR
ncbi:MAG TPA: hypothetical protein VF723_05985 [Pyrinomonadaceae bacterium]|jgi:hypothetical protein